MLWCMMKLASKQQPRNSWEFGEIATARDVGWAGAGGDGGAAGRGRCRRANLHDYAGGCDSSSEQEGVRPSRPACLHDRRAAAAPAGSGGDSAAGGVETAGWTRRGATRGTWARHLLPGEKRGVPVCDGRAAGWQVQRRWAQDRLVPPRLPLHQPHRHHSPSRSNLQSSASRRHDLGFSICRHSPVPCAGMYELINRLVVNRPDLHRSWKLLILEEFYRPWNGS